MRAVVIVYSLEMSLSTYNHHGCNYILSDILCNYGINFPLDNRKNKVRSVKGFFVKGFLN